MEWKNSKFEWLKKSTNRKKGEVSEKLVLDVLKDRYGCNGKRVDRYNGPYDIVLDDNIKVEVKMASISYRSRRPNGRHFHFQSIRENAEYDLLVFFCLFPDGYEIYEITKDRFMDYFRNNPKKFDRNTVGDINFSKGYGKPWPDGTLCLQVT